MRAAVTGALRMLQQKHAVLPLVTVGPLCWRSSLHGTPRPTPFCPAAAYAATRGVIETCCTPPSAAAHGAARPGRDGAVHQGGLPQASLDAGCLPQGEGNRCSESPEQHLHCFLNGVEAVTPAPIAPNRTASWTRGVCTSWPTSFSVSRYKQSNCLLFTALTGPQAGPATIARAGQLLPTLRGGCAAGRRQRRRASGAPGWHADHHPPALER